MNQLIENSYQKPRWEQKYYIQKVKALEDGTPALVQVDEEAQYFVLRFDEDRHARKAMRAYAQSIKHDAPTFAGDILQKLEESETTLGGRAERTFDNIERLYPQGGEEE